MFLASPRPPPLLPRTFDDVVGLAPLSLPRAPPPDGPSRALTAARAATPPPQVDALWRAASKGKFGYSVQKELFAQAARRWGA